MNAVKECFPVEALGPMGPYTTRNAVIIHDVTGAPAAELSLVPAPYVARALTALRKTASLGREQRLAALKSAGEKFLNATIAGLSPEDYYHLVSRISGLGISEVRSAAKKIATHAAHAYERAQVARPQGSVSESTDPKTHAGAGVWVRRGNIFGVHAAGNHPAIHGSWLEALALGYRVAVRPSRREPITPHRLVLSLWEAGFPRNHVVMLPTDHAAADEMLAGCDLAMAYGGQEVMDKYSHLDLLPQGPGRSKILLTSSVNWRDHVELIAASASRGGGTGCTNATSVLVEGDAGEVAALARAVAARLAAIPSLPPEDERAVLPVQSVEAARAVEAYFLRAAEGTTAVLGGEGIVDELGDGSAALRPTVRLLENAQEVPVKGIELAFPCLWIAPWSPADGIEPLKKTLNLVVMSDDESLIKKLLEEQSVRNVYIGAHPSYFSTPNMPHDGYLAEFLMRSKGIVRS